MRGFIIKSICFAIVIGVPLCFAVSIFCATVILWRYVFPS